MFTVLFSKSVNMTVIRVVSQHSLTCPGFSSKVGVSVSATKFLSSFSLNKHTKVCTLTQTRTVHRFSTSAKKVSP